MKSQSSVERTFYVVQSFTRDQQGVRMDPPQEARTEAAAVRMAERIAPRKASVMVFARTGNPETGEFDEPRVVRSLGEANEEDLPF
ncbi:hypothetical protein SAMN02799643_00398 [Methylobacterium sp. UNCCL125]|jgi:hypothetical protein|nr:hypothetical protein SAMN02799643_00398 [Methylobacterium sp. UNCCL125]